MPTATWHDLPSRGGEGGGGQGPPGPAGPAGPTGPAGPAGPAGQSLLSADYDWVTSLTGDPGPAKVGADSADPAAVTAVRISQLKKGNIDMQPMLSMIKAGDRWQVHASANADRTLYGTVGPGDPVDNGTWWSIPVVGVTLGPAAGPPSNGEDVIFRAATTGPQGPAGEDGEDGAPGASASVLSYKFDTATAPPPDVQSVAINNENVVAADKVFIANVDADGTNQRRMLLVVCQAGTTVDIQHRDNDTLYRQYTVTGPAIDRGTHVELPVAWKSDSGPSIGDGDPVVVTVLFAGPPGPTGPKGDTGAAGATGPPGQGVPPGGTTGQVLGKSSTTDYQTGWIDPPTTMAARKTAAATSPGLASGAQGRTTIALSPSYLVIGIQTSVPARVRLYPTDAAAQADFARPIDQEPDAGSQLVMEYVTEASKLTSTVSPSVGGAQMPPSPTAHITLANLSAGTAAVTATLTYLALEG